MKRNPIIIGSHTVHVRSLISDHEKAIVLVHGLGVSGDYYISYAKRLAAFYNVYILDLPGYGKTPKPIKPLSIKQLADIVVRYTVVSELHSPALVGQSMGCQIIAQAIVSAPTMFSRAILLAPTTNIKERSILIQAIRLFQDTFHESLSTNLIVFKNYIRMGVRRFLITSKYMVDDHIEDSVAMIHIPLLFVCGGKDKIAPEAWGKYLTAKAAMGKIVLMQSSPHLMQRANPDELVTITRRFVES